MTIEINEEQWNRLQNNSLNAYIDELVAHCNESYPYLEIKLGKDGLKLALKNAIEKAKNEGFDQRGPVQIYTDLLILFGTDFHTDPQYAWIKIILNNNSNIGQLEKTTLLYHEVTRYLSRVHGEQDENLKANIIKFQNINIEHLNVQWNTYENNVSILLKSLFPQKYQYIEQNNIKHFIRLGIEKSNQYGIENSNHSAFITLIMFLLGHEFDQDIFLPHLNTKLFKQYYSDTDALIMEMEKNIKEYLKILLK
ncbi:hypothetical protein [Xenorhabdus sp. BG5]|uniref:hypothetical protein n=1 Tax=Xenorhabdus sp. BG5 TaxID=2782014 RepID=UPI001D1392B2|nr:hypothetical protein [Xenorhabdus sp. BG5]